MIIASGIERERVVDFAASFEAARRDPLRKLLVPIKRQGLVGIGGALGLFMGVLDGITSPREKGRKGSEKGVRNRERERGQEPRKGSGESGQRKGSGESGQEPLLTRERGQRKGRKGSGTEKGVRNR